MVPGFETTTGTLHYVERGSGDPVVFVHGTLCDYTVWESQVNALSSEFRAIAYSRRYAHPNDRQGDAMDSTVQNNAKDLDDLVGGLGSGKAFGGLVQGGGQASVGRMHAVVGIALDGGIRLDAVLDAPESGA